MNAMPKKGQLAPQAVADADHVRLSLDDTPLETGDPAVADQADPAPQTGTRQRSRRTPTDNPPVPPGLGILELTLTVEVGQLRIPLKDLMAVEPGQLLALDRMTSEPVAVRVNGRLFANGEIVAIGDRFGVRLTSIAEPGSDDA